MKSGRDTGIIRLDKWLWAVCFFKTRVLAQKYIELGQILISGIEVKNSKNITAGDIIDLTLNSLPYRIKVTVPNHQCRPAPEAHSFHAEDMDVAARREQQRLLDQASRVNTTYPDGRPTKHDRRRLDQMKWESW